MTDLMNIREYVCMTAKIISSVLDKEVVICDVDGNIVGDSMYEASEQAEVYKANESSILVQAMRLRQTIRKYDVKSTVESCIICRKKDKCDINSIIVYPITNGEDVAGAIGMYSQYDFFDEKRGREDFFSEFLGQMSELIMSKAEERKRNSLLAISRTRLTNIIEHIDMAVCGIDKNNRMNCFNSKFAEMFGIAHSGEEQERAMPECLSKNPEFMKLLRSRQECVSADMQFGTEGGTRYAYVTLNKLNTGDGTYAGAVVYIKPMENYLREYGKLSGANALIYFDDIIGESTVIRETKKRAWKFAQSNSNILLLGESGTGKELFARAIHNSSRKSAEMFVTVNCAAIPDNLLESELFGYEEGAFTGSARGGKIGKFQMADGGTLFLDEIGEMPLHLQAKLLRAIQEKTITKVGGTKEIGVDIRIIAATNRDLDQMVEDGEFREDLFYRLAVAPIRIPALRERKSDIALLTKYFLRKCSRDMGRTIEQISSGAMETFADYNWPGNVRELQNTIEFAANMAEGAVIGREHLPKRILVKKRISLSDEGIRPLSEVEQQCIRKALAYYGSDSKGKEMAAEALGIGIATLYRKLNKERT